MAQAPDEVVDRLYGLALEDFVAQRDALAKELRADGRREEAGAVKALAKPSVAAWAANQAVRTQTRAARQLWDAGDALVAAQEAVLSGSGSGAELRVASEAERSAVETLVDAARGLMTARGADLSEATLERVRSTLHAGAIDPEARDEVAAGRATRERTAAGAFGAGTLAPAPRPRKGRRQAPAKPARGGKPARGQVAERAQEQRPRERDVKRERAAERERERDRERERERRAASAAVARAQAALDRAREQAADAAERLQRARDRETEAQDALDRARARLQELET
jgi:hypothetical protein